MSDSDPIVRPACQAALPTSVLGEGSSVLLCRGRRRTTRCWSVWVSRFGVIPGRGSRPRSTAVHRCAKNKIRQALHHMATRRLLLEAGEE